MIKIKDGKEVKEIGYVNKELVVLMTNDDINETIVRSCVKIMKEDYPDKLLIIKNHPIDLKNKFAGLVKEMDGTAIITRDAPLEGLLRDSQCRLAITSASGAGTIAILLGVPLIEAMFFSTDVVIPYMESDACLVVRNEDELRKTMKQVFTDKKLRERLFEESIKFKEMLGVDGHATERVVGLIKEMLNERRSKNEVLEM